MQASTDEFIKHLRSTQFALLVVSFTVLLVSLSKPALYENGIEQLGVIEAIANAWSNSENWIDDHAASLVRTRPPNGLIIDLGVEDDKESFADTWSETIGFRYEYQENNETFEIVGKLVGLDDQWSPISPPALPRERIVRPEELFFRDFPIVQSDYDALSTRIELFVTAPDTLQEFSTFWDRAMLPARACIASGHARRAMRVHDTTTGDEIAREVEILDRAKLREHIVAEIPTILLPRRLVEEALGSSISLPSDIPENTYLFVNRGALSDGREGSVAIVTHAILVPAECEFVEMFLQTELVNQFAQDPISVGSTFKGAFPELAELTTDIAHLGFPDLQRVLESQQKLSGETVEVLGIKIGATQIDTWGGFIILTIQIFFLAHLREFCSAFDLRNREFEVPWIAMYRGPVAKLMTFFALTAFPIGVSCYIYMTSISATGIFGLDLLMAVSVVFASFAIHINVENMRRQTK